MFDFLKNREKWKKYYEDIKTFFTPRFLSDAIIPSDVFESIGSLTNNKNEEQAYRFIIACALVNGILVGIPGDLGSGLLLLQAIEFLMAVHIARMVGLEFSWNNTFRLIGAAGVTTFAVLYGFKKVLDIIFKFVAQLPIAAPASFISTSVTTIFLGLFFFLVFSEIKNTGKEKLKFFSIIRIGKNTSTYTYKISKKLFSILFKDFPNLFKTITANVKQFINANYDFKKRVKGELFFAGSMAFLLEGKSEALKGPISEMWLNAWRMTFTSKLPADANIDEIRNLANSYSTEQMPGLENLVRSKFYEILESTHENLDGDTWSAKLHKDPNHPATDVRFYNSETGQVIEVNYKLGSANYIENHLEKYPNVPVITTPEIAEKMNNPLVTSGKYSTEEVHKLSDEQFSKLLNSEHELYLQEGAAAAGAVTLIVYLFPFFIAYQREKIDKEQFSLAVKKFVPEVTSKTLNRIIMLTLIGPLYGWWILMNLIFKVSSHESNNSKKIKYLFYRPLIN